MRLLTYARGAIGIFCDDFERPCFSFPLPVKTNLSGTKRDAGDLRNVRGIVRRAGVDPLQQGSCSIRVSGLKRRPPLCGTAPMALRRRRLCSGDSEIDAAAWDLLGEAVIVACRVVAKEGEMESVFADRGAVASAAVAAGAKEDGHHVEAEADGAGRVDYGRRRLGGVFLGGVVASKGAASRRRVSGRYVAFTRVTEDP